MTDAAGSSSGIRGWARRRWWIFSIYYAEGFPYSLVRLMSTAYFKDHGASLQAIGLASLLGIPWTVKFLWGPLVDSFATKRRWLLTVELAIVGAELGKVCFPGPYLDVVIAARALEAAGKHDSVVREISAGTSIVVAATTDRVCPSDTPDVAFKSGRITGTKYFVPFGAAADRLLVTTPQGLALAEGAFATESMETIDEAARFVRVTLRRITPTRGWPLCITAIARSHLINTSGG